MKKRTIHSHWLRSPIQHQDPNKSNLGCFPIFWKRRKEMITMLSGYTHRTECTHNASHQRQFVLSSVIALFRFAPTVVLLRNQHGLQITKILFITNLLADQRGHYPIFAGNTAVVYLCFFQRFLFRCFTLAVVQKDGTAVFLCVAFCTLTNPKRLPYLLEG